MNAFNFRRRASTASVEDELGNNGEGSTSAFAQGGGGSSTGLSAVSPRRAAARALAASASDDGGAALDPRQQQQQQPFSLNPFARAAAAAAAPFRKVARENSVEKSSAFPAPNALQRGESSTAMLGGDGAAAPFEVEGPNPASSSSARSPSSSSAAAAAAAARDYEASVMRKVDRAVLPCFMVLTLVNYLDRYQKNRFFFFFLIFNFSF